MKFLIDMDGTLNDMEIAYFKYYNFLFDIDLGLTKEDLTTYDLCKVTGSDYALEQERMKTIFETPGFWENIPIQKDAANIVEQLCKEHEVYIVTAPWVPYVECYTEKRKWIEKHLPFFDIDRLIFTSHKYLLAGDVIIDDCPKHLDTSICKWKIKMAHPFNISVRALNANNWKEIDNCINNIKFIEDKSARIT